MFRGCCCCLSLLSCRTTACSDSTNDTTTRYPRQIQKDPVGPGAGAGRVFPDLSGVAGGVVVGVVVAVVWARRCCRVRMTPDNENAINIGANSGSDSINHKTTRCPRQIQKDPVSPEPRIGRISPELTRMPSGNAPLRKQHQHRHQHQQRQLQQQHNPLPSTDPKRSSQLRVRSCLDLLGSVGGSVLARVFVSSDCQGRIRVCRLPGACSCLQLARGDRVPRQSGPHWCA